MALLARESSVPRRSIKFGSLQPRESSMWRGSRDRTEARLQHLGETGPLNQGVQARRKALRIRHINGMEVCKKRPRGFKKRPRGFK
jgi:hypothetical protein